MDRLAARTLAEAHNAAYVSIPLPAETTIPPGFVDDEDYGRDGVRLFDLTPDEMAEQIMEEDGI